MEEILAPSSRGLSTMDDVDTLAVDSMDWEALRSNLVLSESP